MVAIRTPTRFRPLRRLLLFPILTFLVSSASISSAQESLRAVLEAHPVEGFILEPAPASLRFRDDSELNSRLMPVAKNVLTQRGYAI